jgi:hypothetical protein
MSAANCVGEIQGFVGFPRLSGGSCKAEDSSVHEMAGHESTVNGKLVSTCLIRSISANADFVGTNVTQPNFVVPAGELSNGVAILLEIFSFTQRCTTGLYVSGAEAQAKYFRPAFVESLVTKALGPVRYSLDD